MKTIIIHPQDPSTIFLTGIYNNLPSKTVITGGITKDVLRKHMQDHDRIIMCGHGLPNGLFSVGQFPSSNYIIDESMVDVLKNKTNIFIWCYASHFVKRHYLNGFTTGMFISERSEALCLGFGLVKEDFIDESNDRFASIVAKYLDEPLDILYENVVREYGELAKTNPIAKYNWERLFYNPTQPAMFTSKVA